jgi:hypothetical protein
MLVGVMWRTVWLPLQVAVFLLRVVLCVMVYSLAAYGSYVLWTDNRMPDPRLVMDRLYHRDAVSPSVAWWDLRSYVGYSFSVLGW